MLFETLDQVNRLSLADRVCVELRRDQPATDFRPSAMWFDRSRSAFPHRSPAGNSLNHLEIKKTGAAAMGEDTNIEGAIRPRHVGFADFGPIAVVLA